MTVWPDPHSVADGILDDETYDWIGVVEAMRRNGGSPVVAAEADIEAAHAMGRDGWLRREPDRIRRARRPRHASRTDGPWTNGADRIGDDECVGIAMTGIAR